MRKSLMLKTFLRSPLKAMLTFLLVAAASFALCSRMADYTITMREIARAKSFCRGVAALDNTGSSLYLQGSGSGMVSDYAVYEVEGKSWPTEEQIAEFSSLPGVTLADTRYMTAGLVEDYRRMEDEDSSVKRFVMEGTYRGCDYEPNTTGVMDLSFDDIKVIASDDKELDIQRPVQAIAVDDQTFYDNPYPAGYFEKLKPGTRCLIIGEYDLFHSRLRMGMGAEAFQVLDGLGEDYLETNAFAYQKGLVGAINQSVYTYDIVYTSDMRSIPRFNEHNMAISQGRFLLPEDRDACVVNELFLDVYGLSIGDQVSIQLGDRLCHQGRGMGARPRDAGEVSDFICTEELEIVGAYRNVDDNWMRMSERNWSYSTNTIFVPRSLLPVEVPDGYEVSMGEFSLLIEDAHDIEGFQNAAEPFVAEMGIPMRFSDGGWLSMKDSFEAGRWAASLTALLSVVGAALALLLAAYLYIGRNKKTYAIMRTLGVSSKMARDSIVLPFFLLSVPAMAAGGMAGLFYTSQTAGAALAGLAADGLEGYVPDTAFSPGVAVLCLFLELAFTLSITAAFLWKMKRLPPLVLLQEGTVRASADTKAEPAQMESAPGSARIDLAKLPSADGREASFQRKYPAPCQAASYILRHMRRSIGKTAVSLSLVIVLAASIGTFVIARLTYQDTAREMDVKGRALMFASSAVPDLQRSDLINDFYCYDSFAVRINDREVSAPMTFTNDLARYLAGNYSVEYALGYDASIMGGTDSLCLLGQALAEELGLHPGDQVALLSDSMYVAMADTFKEREELRAKVSLKARKYTVAGIISSEAADVNQGIFAPPNRIMQDLYNPPFSFQFQYCEFTLADNEKLDSLNSLLEEKKKLGMNDAPTASFYIDTAGLRNIQRICGLLEALFPIAVTAALLIGLFGPGLMIIQLSREAAFLRILGVTKKRARCMLVLEQVVLCIAGLILVAGGFMLYNAELLARSAEGIFACWALYFLGCFCGASVAAIQVTKHKVLELLQVRE